MGHHRRPRGTEKPLPKRGRVVHAGKPCTITFVEEREAGSYTYTLRPHNAEGRTLHAVPHAELLRHMADHARYTIGQEVMLAQSPPMRITKRQWDFRNGTVWYYAAVPNRTIGAGWFRQETMMRLDRDLDPILDTDAEPTPPAHSSPPHDW